MIVLDTNVVSELMQERPDPAVLRWVAAQDGAELNTTAITIAEIGYGIARLPSGRRRDQLHAAATQVVGVDLASRIIAFDHDAAKQYGEIVATRERAGRPVGVPDAQIAAICRANGAPLATRDRADFEGTGIELVDPWTAKT